jgi:EAL and modified HD-GYP domain-containing signal transduction protein
MVARKDPPAYKASYFRFLQEVNRADADFDRLEEILRQDVTMSLKLLRYINSAQVGVRSRVDSIRQALALLGLATVRRWATLLAMASMCEDKPSELVVTSLARARFCERVGEASGRQDEMTDLFMVGLFSVVDAILDRPMIEILADLPLSDGVKGALMGRPEGMGRVLGLALAYEHAEWDRLPAFMERLRLDPLQLPAIYREAVAWAEQIFQAAGA